MRHSAEISRSASGGGGGRSLLRGAGLAALFLVPLLVKLAGLPYVSPTSHDNELLKDAYALVHQGRFLPVGDSFELPGYGPISYGPLHAYLVASAMVFSPHTYGPYVLLAVLSGLATLLLYRLGRDFFGEAAGWLAAILYGFSGFILFFSLDAYRTNFVPLFALVFFYSMYAVKIDGRPFFILPLFASLAILLQLHVSTFVAPLLAALFFLWRPKVGRGWLLAGLICFAVFSAPWLRYEASEGYRDIQGIARALVLNERDAGEMDAGFDTEFVRRFFSSDPREGNPFFTPLRLFSYTESLGEPGPLGHGKWKAAAARLCGAEFILFLAGFFALIGVAALRGPARKETPSSGFRKGFLPLACALSIGFLLFFPHHPILHFQFSFPLMVLVLSVFLVGAASLNPWLRRFGLPLLFVAVLFQAGLNSALMHGAFRSCELRQTTLNDDLIPYRLQERMAEGLLSDRDFEPADTLDTLFAYRIETGVGITQLNYLFFLGGIGREERASGPRLFNYLLIREADLPFGGEIRAETIAEAGWFRALKYRRLDQGMPWRFSDVTREEWFLPGLDEAGWEEVPMPCLLCFLDRTEGRCDTVSDNYESYYFRGRIFHGPDAPGVALIVQSSVGSIRVEEVWLNGRPLFDRKAGAEVELRESEVIVDLSPSIAQRENVVAVKFSGAGESYVEIVKLLSAAFNVIALDRGGEEF